MASGVTLRRRFSGRRNGPSRMENYTLKTLMFAKGEWLLRYVSQPAPSGIRYTCLKKTLIIVTLWVLEFPERMSYFPYH